jgi:hypothetical protein
MIERLVTGSIAIEVHELFRNEFARNISLDKRDFAAIEFLLRKGRRQLDVYSSPGIRDVH